jgi:hypothetical protein
MNPRVKEVRPLPDYRLRLTFEGGEIRIFDVSPYLDKGVFRGLRDSSAFNSVRAFLGSVAWADGQDFCPDTLYLESIPVTGSDVQAAQKTGTVHVKTKDLLGKGA